MEDFWGRTLAQERGGGSRGFVIGKIYIFARKNPAAKVLFLLARRF